MTDEPYQSLEDRAKGQRLARDERLATLEAALRTIQSVIPGYLKQKMTAEDFALIVIGAVDSKAVNQALEGKK